MMKRFGRNLLVVMLVFSYCSAFATDTTVVKARPQVGLVLSGGGAKGAALIGEEPADCLVVEDAISGITAAHAAGMDAVGVPTTFSKEELTQRVQPEYLLDHIKELADLPELN